MAGNFNLTTTAKHMYCVTVQYMLHLAPAVYRSECKTQYKIRDYFDISGQPGRKRFVLDRSEPIKGVS